MAKYEKISQLIERRIRRGDYTLRDIPAEERLAVEVGASRTTARRAVLKLLAKGLLVRQPNGRVAVNRDGPLGKAGSQFALLTPAWTAGNFDRWRISVEMLASKFNVGLRKVDFVHWDDSIILEVFDRFDGVFLITGSEPLPPKTLALMREHRTPLAVLDGDESAEGMRSVDLTPPSDIRMALDHLYGLGHRQIACLNTQPLDRPIRRRMEEWEAWHREKGLSSRLINEPVRPYEEARPKAFEVLSNFFQARSPDFTAMVVTTTDAAIGAMRAMHEAGVRIGRDLSVAAIADEGQAKFQIPSLTSTQMPDPKPFLSVVFEWMLGSSDAWPASLLLRPANVSLFIGESTGPAPEIAQADAGRF